MPSRARKEEKLKANIEASAERATRMECQRLHIGRQSKEARKIHEMHRREFLKSARRIDKTKLHEVWNHF